MLLNFFFLFLEIRKDFKNYHIIIILEYRLTKCCQEACGNYRLGNMCVFNSNSIFLIRIKISKLEVKYLSKKTRFKWFQCNLMIHIHSIPSQFLLPSTLKPKYITPPNEKCVQIWNHLQIYTINWNRNTHLWF